MRVAGFEAEGAWRRQLVNGTAALKTRAEKDLKGVVAEFADAQMQPSAPVPAPVLDVEPAEPAPKKKRLSRLEERRQICVRVAAGGGGDSGSAEPQAAVTGRRVLIEREVSVYLAEQGQLDVDAFNLFFYTLSVVFHGHGMIGAVLHRLSPLEIKSEAASFGDLNMRCMNVRLSPSSRLVVLNATVSRAMSMANYPIVRVLCAPQAKC